MYGLQKELLLTIGADNPYVKPKQLYNTLEKLTETAGFPSAEPFFSEPDEAEVQAKLEAAKNAPDPEMLKIQAQMQGQKEIEQFKTQATMQLEQGKLQIQRETEQMKADVARDKERAQAEADMIVKRQEALMSAMLEEQKMNFEREKFQADMALREREMQSKREIELLKLGARDGETGPVSKDDDRNNAMLEAVKGMVGEFAKAQSGKKRVVRDENGDIIGVETVN